MMNTLSRLLEQWEGEEVIIHHDRPSGAWIIIAVHSTRLGPAIGGTRMKPYPDLEAAVQDALRLAGGMTLKWAAAGMDCGGGKAVVAVPPDLDPDARVDLLRRYGTVLGKHKGLFLTGPDVGTSAEDMDIIAETGDPYVFCRTAAGGGSGEPGPFTALGVFSSMEVAAKVLYGKPSLEGKRVLVQGVGSVGRALVDLLQKAGAEVLFSDVNHGVVGHFRDTVSLGFVSPDDVYDTPCDIFSPCALGAVLNEKTIPALRCQAVVGAANNQLAVPEDAARLRERRILYAPDFIVNSGGAVAALSMETRGCSRQEAEERVVQAIRENLSHVFELAETEGCTTDEAAQRLAERRLAGTE
jgi:leucine dehydrogenase